MAQVSCRVPDAVDAALQEAAAELGAFRSDVLRRSLLHYIDTNPHGLEAFMGEADPRRPASSRAPYDPTRDV